MMKLREIIVQEWMGCRRHLYEEFLADCPLFESHANLFLRHSFYDCELGNTMPLAMADALGVIFTSHERALLYYVTYMYQLMFYTLHTTCMVVDTMMLAFPVVILVKLSSASAVSIEENSPCHNLQGMQAQPSCQEKAPLFVETLSSCHDIRSFEVYSTEYRLRARVMHNHTILVVGMANSATHMHMH